MKLKLEFIIFLGFITSLVILIIVALASIASLKTMTKNELATKSTQEVLTNLATLMSDITSAESGLRGYIITGDVKFLDAYNQSLPEIDHSIKTLNYLTQNDKEEEKQLEELKPVIFERLEIMESLKNTRSEIGYESASLEVASGKGKLVQEKIRHLASELRDLEIKQLKIRNLKTQNSVYFARSIIVFGSIVAIIFVVFSLFMSRIGFRKLKQADESLRINNLELQHLNEEKDKFFSIVAHDLKGPFSSFMGLTQIMAEDFQTLSKDEIHDYVSSLRDSSKNLFGLLENLLSWSRIRQGLIPFNKLSLQLSEVVDQSISPLLASAHMKGIKISKNISEKLMVLADKDMLQTILRNLVSNALKFTPRGGEVAISADLKSNNLVEIAIRDSGIGMNQFILDNLFRIDVKTSRAGTDGEASSGLGLILCKDFVENHGGMIWAESEEGKGSVFYFTIPAFGLS